MINLISNRLMRNAFDDVMEVAWATMWNVTDETAVNCERFLNLDGMKYFLGCLRVGTKNFILVLSRYHCYYSQLICHCIPELSGET